VWSPLPGQSLDPGRSADKIGLLGYSSRTRPQYYAAGTIRKKGNFYDAGKDALRTAALEDRACLRPAMENLTGPPRMAGIPFKRPAWMPSEIDFGRFQRVLRMKTAD
jgi:hypothetical protein